MSIKTLLLSIKRIIKGEHKRYIPVNLCGTSLQVLPGTCRANPDQDDAWWFYLSKHHHVIFDIGCNIGYTALIGLIHDPNKKMILVDPNPKALQKAALNIINNGIGNKVYYQAAFVGNTVDDTVRFYTIGAGAAGSMYPTHAKTAASMNAFMDVKTITLDHLFIFYDMKPDLVKIDVEGAETQVMEGAKVLAKDTQCTFFIEMHTVENLGMEAAAAFMLDWCAQMDYKAWYLKTGSLLTSAAIIKDRGKCHLLLLPENKSYPNYLKGITQNAPLPNSI